MGSTGLGSLPAIASAVTIDGYTQPGAKANTLTVGNNAMLKVQLNGTYAGTGADGIRIGYPSEFGSNVTVKGLVINRFSGYGVSILSFCPPDASPIEVHSNKVQGNFIGTAKNGTTDLGNTYSGVFLVAHSQRNTIGGTASGAGNIISGNGGDGVTVFSGAKDNSILSNRMFLNDELGIDLDANGVTENDTDDADTGANHLQNFPVIDSAIRNSSGETIISGTLKSNPNQTYTIQCFEADTDSTNHGEGEMFLAQDTTVTTDGAGDASFTCSSTSEALDAGDEVSATATNTSSTVTLLEAGDTSEFSGNVAVKSST